MAARKSSKPEKTVQITNIQEEKLKALEHALADLDKQFGKGSVIKMGSEAIAKDIPVYMGEFGCSMRAKSNTRAWAFYKYYMEYVVKAAKTYNLPCFLWDNGVSGTGKEQHGYVHHGNGNYIGNSKEILDVIYKAWNNDSETYTLDYVYSTAPKF